MVLLGMECAALESARTAPYRATAVALCSTHCCALRMARVIPQRELRNQNAQVLDAVQAGESFVVTRDGIPVAELRPVSRGQRRLVAKADVAATMAAGSPLDAAAFRRDLDTAIDQRLPDLMPDA
jgi:prevent-host-death family protein